MVGGTHATGDDFLESACATGNFIKGCLVTGLLSRGKGKARKNIRDYVVLAPLILDFEGIFGEAQDVTSFV